MRHSIFPGRPTAVFVIEAVLINQALLVVWLTFIMLYCTLRTSTRRSIKCMKWCHVAFKFFCHWNNFIVFMWNIFTWIMCLYLFLPLVGQAAVVQCRSAATDANSNDAWKHNRILADGIELRNHLHPKTGLSPCTFPPSKDSAPCHYLTGLIQKRAPSHFRMMQYTWFANFL